jgi:hypothetical protein
MFNHLTATSSIGQQSGAETGRFCATCGHQDPGHMNFCLHCGCTVGRRWRQLALFVARLCQGTVIFVFNVGLSWKMTPQL